jgi:adenosylcobyric acid synthase
VLGVCGGFQMLGMRIADPDGVEGPPGEAVGLGLLDIATVLGGDKIVRPVTGSLAAGGARFDGYEIHVGRTEGAGLARPLLRFDDGAADGAVSPDGRVSGCYVHGLFDAGAARAALLAELGAASQGADQRLAVDRALEEIGAALEQAFDIPRLAAIAGLGPGS